jgi:hypothetical protein
VSDHRFGTAPFDGRFFNQLDFSYSILPFSSITYLLLGVNYQDSLQLLAWFADVQEFAARRIGRESQALNEKVKLSNLTEK